MVALKNRPKKKNDPMAYQRKTKDQVAARVAQDIPEGVYVNLGIGMPTQVANHLPKGLEIILHSETASWAWAPRLHLKTKISI